MDSLVNQAIPVSRGNLEIEENQDSRDLKVRPVRQVYLDPVALRDLKGLRVNKDPVARMVNQAHLVKLGCLGNQVREEGQGSPDHPALMGNQAEMVLRGHRENEDSQEPRVRGVHLEIQGSRVSLDALGSRACLEIQGSVEQ